MAGTTLLTCALLDKNPEAALRKMLLSEKEEKENKKAIQKQNHKTKEKLFSPTTKKPFAEKSKHSFTTPATQSRRRG